MYDYVYYNASANVNPSLPFSQGISVLIHDRGPALVFPSNKSAKRQPSSKQFIDPTDQTIVHYRLRESLVNEKKLSLLMDFDEPLKVIRILLTSNT